MYRRRPCQQPRWQSRERTCSSGLCLFCLHLSSSATSCKRLHKTSSRASFPFSNKKNRSSFAPELRTIG
jgi:hypothetical protein